MNNYKIAILGLGGIGGYIGGKLAGYYSNSKNIDIIFTAGRENGEEIKRSGFWSFKSNDLLR
jgi:2-dehydropantoate 2-reductase